MVRVISSGFSTPRSRHSSGEDMIDRFAAMKALSALSDDEKHSKDEFTPKTPVIDCNTDTNDSFSGPDSDEEARVVKRDAENNELHAYQDPAKLKKDRRRERNKVSAQNYRLRRRQQVSAAQKTLESLENKNKNLLEKVRQLEAEKQIVEEYLRSCVRVPWCPYHQPVHPRGPPSPPCPPCNPCCQNPTIPEECPIETYSGSNIAEVTGITSNVHCAPGNKNVMIVASNSSDNNNNNMPLCMSGVDVSTSGSSVS